MLSLIRASAFVFASMLAAGATVALAQTSPPPTPPANSGASTDAGCTYTATSATATGGQGHGAPRHLDEGQTVTNMASHVTYVCRSGHLVRQQ